MDQFEHRFLGVSDLPRDLSPLDIDLFFSLDAADMAAIGTRRGPLNRLGVSLQLCFIRMSGRLLNSSELVSPEILDHLAAQLKIEAPDLASIRSIYRRRITLHAHQNWAATLAGYGDLSAGVKRRLSAYLRREAASVPDNGELVRKAMIWIHRHRYLLPARRTIVEFVHSTRRYHEARLFDQIRDTVGETAIDEWIGALTAPAGRRGVSVFEDLRSTHRGRTTAALERQATKISTLRRLGADRLDPTDLNFATLQHYAERMMAREVGKIGAIREPLRTIELASFLRFRLLRLSDQAADMADHRIANLWSKAHLEAAGAGCALLVRHQRFYKELGDFAGREDISDDALGAYVRTRLRDFGPNMRLGRTARARVALSGHADELLRVAKSLRVMELEHAATPIMNAVITHLERRDHQSATDLLSLVGRKWREGVAPDDAEAAIDMASAASAVILKRSLNNGSLGVVHSIDHRAPEHRLIPEDLWEKDKSRFVADLGVTMNAGAFLRRIKPVIDAGLEALAGTVREGELVIANGRLIIPRSKGADDDADIDRARRSLFETIGGAQLPDIVVDVDAATQFSRILLGRPARSDNELITLYAALLALGSDLVPASAARMIAGVEPKAIGRVMARLVAARTLREANDSVLAFAASHDIAALWGDGANASSDMMSLEASRNLWSARVDPRRRSYAVGTYTHVLNQWSIIYDQPIVLNRRQAGAAIEGALRQSVTTIDRLAVDTHGHTHFSMALAKCCGFDLCPRLARLSKRKLYLPKGYRVPPELKEIVSTSISTRTIAQGWDGLLRLASSVKAGFVPATFVMDKFGCAAKGDPVYEAGAGLGKILLTLYLSDYLTKPDFQREIGRLLSQGESVHVLQRAIHSKPLGAKSGRDIDELTAISNALTLIANIIIARNTAQMQRAVCNSPRRWPEDHLRHVAPVAHAHINLRGIMTFNVESRRDELLGGGQSRNAAPKIRISNL